MTVKAEVIPWEAKAGQFGVVVDDGTEAEAYFVGSRLVAERKMLTVTVWIQAEARPA